MRDILIRSFDDQTISYIDIARENQNRESYLRGLVKDAVESDMVNKHRLMPNLKDIQHRHSVSALNSLDGLYHAGLLAYPRTVSRYLKEADWPDAAHIIIQLRRISDGDDWLEVDDGIIFKPRMFDCPLSSGDIDRLIDKLDTAINQGFPAPASLYNDALVVDHPAISPVVYKKLPCREDARAGAFTPQARAIYRQVACGFVMAHWKLLDTLPGVDAISKGTYGPWNPFRDKSTGAIVAARWEGSSRSWEVAGQEVRVSPKEASAEWVSL